MVGRIESRELGTLGRYALISQMISALRDRNSWCGETHIQKAVYFVQELSSAPLGYEFVLYKHGPFSFDLKTELASMRASSVIVLSFPLQGYGPSLSLTEFGKRILGDGSEEIQRFQKAIRFIADWFSDKDVRELEKLSTAFLVTIDSPKESVERRAHRLNELKPHIDEYEAEQATIVLDEKIIEYQNLLKESVSVRKTA